MVMKIVDVKVVFQTWNIVGRFAERTPDDAGNTVQALLSEMQLPDVTQGC